MTLWEQIKFALSRPPRGQIKFIVTTYIDNTISKRFYGKSLVGNFLQMIYCCLANADLTDFTASGSPWSSQQYAKQTSGALVAVHNITPWQANANVGALNKGIVLGSGTTSPTAADYIIETIINHGTGSGELSYESQTAPQGCEISSLTTSFILQRLFVNNTGSQVDVNEIVLYSAYSTYIFLLYRDVLSSADEIPNGSTYRVTLEISVTT